MKTVLIAISFLIFIASPVLAQIIHVPGDQPTIQEGIDIANEGDTVLVAPGTYIENIDFNGKNITVASLFLISQDTSYISKTIIDGGALYNEKSVVIFSNGEDSTSRLTGFTITNGDCSTYSYGGGGIYISSACPTLDNLLIFENKGLQGGGIYCYNSNSLLNEIQLINNIAVSGFTGSNEGFGAGIYCKNSNIAINDVVIMNNKSYGPGGGIYCIESNPVLKGVRIINNEAKTGGGIYFQNSSPAFDENNRCDIHDNRAINYGSELYSDTLIHVVTDTFTVLNPTSFHVDPIDNFTFDILHGFYQQADANLYVSPNGDNGNSGLIPAEPLKTIYHAFVIILSDSLHQHTIHLLNGNYSPSTNNEVFPLNIPDYISLNGESESGVILDAEDIGRVLLIDNNCSTSLFNLTITGGLVEDTWDGGGGGILCRHSDPFIQNVTITDNSTWTQETDFERGGSGGIKFYESDAILQSVTISDNGGGAAIGNNSNPLFQNVISFNNYGRGIYINSSCYPEFIDVLVKKNSGGGLYLVHDSSFTLSGLTVINNFTTGKGGGIYCEGNPQFDSINRCNIYLNHAQTGNDIYSEDSLHVIVDTFSVISPTTFHAAPLGNFSFDILNGKFEQTTEDLYVSPLGDNNNSGLTEADPIKNLHCAFTKSLADSLHPQLINLLEGTYSDSANGDLFPIHILDYITLKGVSANQVTLTADGESEVIKLLDKNEIRISDLTVTGGYAARGNGGGIYIVNSDVLIENLVFKANFADGDNMWNSGSGGGLYCKTSSVFIRNTNFLDNTSSYGGGIFCIESNLTLEDVLMKNNQAERNGGGLYCMDSDPQLKRVRISDNSAASSGGGIYCGEYSVGSNPFFQEVSFTNNKSYNGGGIACSEHSIPVFDSLHSCNIYFNYAVRGNDIYSDSEFHVVVDTFTVLHPTGFHASLLEKFTFDILNGMVSQSNADLYVSPLGDNSNSGLSEEEALKTIYVASTKLLTDSVNPRTIHLANGTYSPSTTGDRFPIFIPDYTRLNGTSATSTILDAEEQSGVFISHNNIGIEVSNLSLTGSAGRGITCVHSSPVLKNLIISGNDGGGISCGHSSPEIRNVIIADNYSFRGGGINCSNYSSPELYNVSIRNNDGYYGGGGHFSNSSPVLTDVEIINNTSEARGGGLCLHFDNTVLRNVTIADNVAGMYGGGIYSGNSDLSVQNSILWNNIPEQVFFSDNNYSDTLTVSWSDIQDGESGIVNENGIISWMEGNIDKDPQFTNSGDHPFQLTASSPCVNTGNPDTSGLFLPTYDMAGGPRIWNNRIDMGAYEWSNVGVEELPVKNSQLTINTYPNPFSTYTSIEYELSKPGTVNFTIFNHLGQIVESINPGNSRSGKQQYVWNASGMPVGVYFVQVRAGQEMAARKIVKMR